MTSEKGSRKDKNQNIQVFVRLRPLNQRERDIKSLGVIEVVHNREVHVRQSQQSSHTKKFTFDRAFGPQAKQVEVYQDVVSPLIEEVLAGYNCTVFAYGQTGTGKTHTMVGESTGDEHTWQNDPLAGIIPRALSQLFDELRLSNTEYTVRVSYLELYNEELFDLLAACEDNSKLRIYEDVTRKGSNIVNGLEEITVSNKNEVYKIMAQGQERKRVASTLMNAQSSRSHTVFTIVVHMRENSAEGEELVKIGKLNLVDLAGSENISKAGSDNPAKRERARECVNINQSLLTLGRVITALVERHPHIPYRESKLTRILQESLGGRTKTSIIATISPGHKDLEETMSTLEYAHRAKNIQNKPEVNQKMTKKAILKEYAEEIDRLKRDLQASRDKNGVYLATDTYTEITLKQEEQRKEIQELLLQKRAVEEQRDKVEAMFSEINRTLEQKDSELNITRSKLSSVQTKLANTVNMLQSTKLECEEQKHLVQTVSSTERALGAQARALLGVADAAAEHLRALHDSAERRRNVETQNLQVTKTYREQAAQHRANITAGTKHFTMTLAEELTGLHTALEDFATNNTTSLQGNKVKLEDILQQMQETMDTIKKLTDESHNKLVSATESQRARLRASVECNNSAIQSAVHVLLQRAVTALQAAQNQDVSGNVAKFVQQWYQGAAARVSSLCHAQRSFVSRMQESTNSQIQAANVQKNSIMMRKDQKDGLVRAWNEEVERDKIALEKRLTDQLEEIEVERNNCRSRLQAWMEEERRVFEERLKNHVETETAVLEQRLSKQLAAIEQERLNLEARMASHLTLQERTLESNAEEMQAMLQDLQHWETIRNSNSNTIKSYDKDFDEGTSAISTDMEVFSSNVVEVVDHIYQELIKAMQLANQQTELEAQTVVSQVQAAGAHFVGDTDGALEDAVETNKKLVHEMIDSMQAKTGTSTRILNEMSTALTTLVSATETASAAHRASVQGMNAQLGLFEDNLRNAVVNLEDVEERCLNEEYKMYSPTGRTPARASPRYPRALAATSPHERVLARFRARRLPDHEDCIVVESDTESRVTSDCESSTSEDFSEFVAPSPPLAPPAPTPRHNTQPDMQHNVQHNTQQQGNHVIVKCTSETDIYSIKKHQDSGKENANRSISYKKPSKLPAPASNKKPFVERNGTDN